LFFNSYMLMFIYYIMHEDRFDLTSFVVALMNVFYVQQFHQSRPQRLWQLIPMEKPPVVVLTLQILVSSSHLQPSKVLLGRPLTGCLSMLPSVMEIMLMCLIPIKVRRHQEHDNRDRDWDLWILSEGSFITKQLLALSLWISIRAYI